MNAKNQGKRKINDNNTNYKSYQNGQNDEQNTVALI